jgi:hypothetical protein
MRPAEHDPNSLAHHPMLDALKKVRDAVAPVEKEDESMSISWKS